MSRWIPVNERLPDDGQRCLCHLPGNQVYLPGKTGATEVRQVVILRFLKDHFLKNPSRTGYNGEPHFWQGEGSSNKFFAEVSHWMPLPDAP
ncbi:MAG TPA: DUF551 domain-containing protein [Flavobacteriales bacterium]|nr:DUF551 domain-containing protein [Flavobacteriales bacterium]HNU56155.1 DUF551 domain-containing protein [Flavobacteriales bacterium]